MRRFIVFLIFGLRNLADHQDWSIINEADTTCFAANYSTIMISIATYFLRVTPKSSLVSYASSLAAGTSNPHSAFDHCSDIKTFFCAIPFLNLKMK